MWNKPTFWGVKKTLLKLHQLQSWLEKLKVKGHGGLQVFNLDNPGIKKFFPGSERPKSKLASKTKIAWQIESEIQTIKICRIKNWFKSIEKGHHKKWEVTKQLKELKSRWKDVCASWQGSRGTVNSAGYPKKKFSF